MCVCVCVCVCFYLFIYLIFKENASDVKFSMIIITQC